MSGRRAQRNLATGGLLVRAFRVFMLPPFELCTDELINHFAGRGVPLQTGDTKQHPDIVCERERDFAHAGFSIYDGSKYV